jgi:hypothetical protein
MKIDLLALYQKSLLGGLGGLLGWALINVLAADVANVYLKDLLTGACVGLTLGACCGVWDGLFRSHSWLRAVRGAGLGAAIGLAGGMIGLVVGEAIFDVTEGGLAPRAFGWGLFGAFVGASEGVGRHMPWTAAYGSYGGFVGGLFGGSTYVWLFGVCNKVFQRETAQAIGGAVGLVLLGLFIGAFMGLVEDLLRSAWLLFTSGRLEGQTRTLDPSKPEVRLGRSEAADICIVGDPQIARQHARILVEQGAFVIEAVEGALFVGRGSALTPVKRQPLAGGETIQLGGSRAQFCLGSAKP